MASSKTAKKASGKQAAKKASTPTPRSMPEEGKDPKGGLTAKGRAFFAEKEGLHLRPGVQGPADTPEKMVRKGSFLRRHFAHPRGPMKNDKGEPTRLALSAHAWGEPVPQTMDDARKLADEGHELLEQYHEVKEAKSAGKKVVSKAAKKATAKATAKRSSSRTAL